jgi:RND family efflux transporter MFP subunit
MENKIQDLNAQLRTEQAGYDLNKLELERLKFESENKRKLKELEFQQAAVRLNKIKRNLDLKPKLDNYDRKIQEIKIIQRENEIRNAKGTLKLMVIRSPQEGIFQVKSNWNGQHIKLGDNQYLGNMLASIPDIRKMRANTYVNETDITKLSLGMKAIVRLDALPSVPFNGIVTNISKICTTRETQKIFEVVVEVPEKDLRLKPGMTVSCEFICYESDKDLFVPNNCLLKEKGHSYVFIKRGRKVRKTEVQTGVANANYTIISSGVKQGQKLVPFDEILNPKNI